MYRIWNEIKAGWKEVQWIWYFSFYLILITPIAVLIAYSIDGEFSTPPSIAQTLLVVLSALLSYFLAKTRPTREKTETIRSSFWITRAPGSRLLAVADYLFRPAAVELTFKPLIGDWRAEYFEALKQGRMYKARWITIRYRVYFARTFIMVMGMSKVFSLFKQLSK